MGLSGEVAVIKEKLSIGARIDGIYGFGSGDGGSASDADFKSFQAAVKYAPFDDGQGNAVAVAVKTGIIPTLFDPVKLVPLGVAAEGSVRFSPVNLMLLVSYDHFFMIDSPSSWDHNELQMAFQPSVSLAGRHSLGVYLAYTNIRDEATGNLDLFDVGGGYILAKWKSKLAFMVFTPINKRDARADIGLLLNWAYEF